jgi:Tfp pilus assembly protein FimT
MTTPPNKILARRGLTILDLVVVIAIIAVLSAVAVPRYSLALVRYRAAITANRVAADLALAQNIAKITSAGQTVTFSYANNNYQFPGYTSPLNLASATNYTTNLSVDPYEATLAWVYFNGATQLTYDRFGQPSSGGLITIQVGTTQKTINVDANTGKATVQ